MRYARVTRWILAFAGMALLVGADFAICQAEYSSSL
jgi:hypothetical protein